MFESLRKVKEVAYFLYFMRYWRGEKIEGKNTQETESRLYITYGNQNNEHRKYAQRTCLK